MTSDQRSTESEKSRSTFAGLYQSDLLGDEKVLVLENVSQYTNAQAYEYIDREQYLLQESGCAVLDLSGITAAN
jgi:hypothetical protein